MATSGELRPKSISIIVFTWFYPRVGGIETLAELLAREWSAQGHRVTIVTDAITPLDNGRAYPFAVLRNPGVRELIPVVRQADVVVHQGISLRAIWPLTLVRRPLVAVHHHSYGLSDSRRPWHERIKVWIARNFASNISVSSAVRNQVGCDGAVIPNPYDDQQFLNYQRPRGKDLIFVGRLVTDKGVAVLLDALDELRRMKLAPTLTIVGDGPERSKIEEQLHRLRLNDQVALTGQQRPNQIAELLNDHRILVVPSLWDEPFGIVALEGAACGCVIVGSSGGGLPEAIGPCGLTFPNGDHRALANVLAGVLGGGGRLEQFRDKAAEHLARHRVDVIAQQYTELFYDVLARRRA